MNISFMWFATQKNIVIISLFDIILFGNVRKMWRRQFKIYVFLFQNLDSALLNGQPFQGGVDENHLLTASPGVSTRHERVPARYVRAARSVFRVMPTSVWGFGG